MSVFPNVKFSLPGWMDDLFSERKNYYPTIEDRMALVIDLARRNADAKTGGPFGAGIFEMESGRLVAPGSNLVESANCSVAHAEMVAIMVAQKFVGSYDLGMQGLPAMELVTSTEPCAMCLGAVIWCGVRRLVCGARDADARAIGFDEGPKPDNWIGELEGRGIAVLRDVERKKAIHVIRHYSECGGLIYNATRN